MIITDKFVMLNFPKTGSTFARNKLKKIHHKKDNTPFQGALRKIFQGPPPTLIELMHPMIDRKHDYGAMSQHGTYRQIPEEHAHKIIVSIVRNPFDRYVSGYLYGWWKKSPYASVEELKRAFPRYPHLSFEEYYQMLITFMFEDYMLDGITPKADLGPTTIQFINFYFEEPKKILNIIDADYITQKKFNRDMPDITFLHQENLNLELHNFLSRIGYSKIELDMVLDAKRVNVTSRNKVQEDLCNFYTQSLVEDIFLKDRLIFELFPEYTSTI